MRAAGYLQPHQTFADRPLLPNMGTVRYIKENGSHTTGDYYDFLREFANNCSHAEYMPHKPKICFDNVVICLRGYHMLLQRYYSSRLSDRIPAFNADLMPIRDYVVYDCQIPKDSVRSKCIKEFFAYTLDDGEPAKYALIRMYNRSESDRTFMLRNQKCFIEASKASMSIVPQGMASTLELTPKNDPRSSFYMICYEFNRKAQPLSNVLLANMTMAQRLEMCGRIVRCLDGLHNSDTPIYHRMLSFESVYVSQFRQTPLPYIIKFDYAKIITDKPLNTVYMDAVNAQRHLKNKPLFKYLAPEWARINDDTPNVDWAKVDVYSLGVLIGDILMGEIGNEVVDLRDLVDMGVSELIVDVLDRMLSEAPRARCSMDEVREVFDCEVR
jgi:hypothetical protein